MRISANTIVLGLVTSLSILNGCGEKNTTTDPQTTTTKSTTANLYGSVYKGPIDGATIQVVDVSGTVVASGQSQNGAFSLTNVPIQDQKVLFIKSLGGTYVDEATGQTVTPDANSGLMTVLNANELQTIAQTSPAVMLTPETTLVAKLVDYQLTNGVSETQALATAELLINTQLLYGTAPIADVVTESVMRIGNLAAPSASDQSLALARNRAVSFSFNIKSLGLAPQQIFEFLDKRALDLQDGILDGKQSGSAITLAGPGGNNVALNSSNTTYAMARVEQFNTMVNRCLLGQSSTDEQTVLTALGMDMTHMNELTQQSIQAQALTSTNLTATNLPGFQYLPLIQDEDGNPNDTAANYTLDVMDNVNVTINTPNGSWLTPMKRYNGLQHAPLIVAHRGDQMSFMVNNNLNEDTTVHWHGFKIPGDQDGGPDYLIATNTSKNYNFKLVQAAAPLWFHPHPHQATATQVYAGLAGGLVVKDAITDSLENNLQLPAGNYDIPLLIQDRSFGADDGTGVRPLLYAAGTGMAAAAGMLGNQILVNDVELPSLKVDTRQYRFRLYNGSNARTYDIALHNGATFNVIGTDGGLLPAPVVTNHVILAAGERAEIVIDFGAYPVGENIMLVSRAFNGSQMSMMTTTTTAATTKMHMGGMSGGSSASSLANGAAFDIMRFDVTTQVADDISLYSALPANADINTRLTAADAENNRDFVMSMRMGMMMSGMQFQINGKTFDPNRVDELVPSGATETWTIQNVSMMAHPFHAHAIQWQILDRNAVAASGIDLGWKDTVLVQPGETIRFIGRFDPVVNTGQYMYHCHILEHEDAGMMGIFQFQ